MPHPSRTLTQLLTHCRNLIWKGTFVGGRISRGEYWISYLILVALSSIIGTILRHLAGNIGELIASIIGVVFSIFQIKLISKRSHDIGETARYSFVPLFAIVGIAALYVLGVVGLRQSGESSAVYGGKFAIGMVGQEGMFLVIIGIGLSIRLIVRSCKLMFKKGDISENAYGDNPLAHQATGNKEYRIVGFIMILVSIVASALGKPMTKTTYDTIDPTATDSIEEVVTP